MSTEHVRMDSPDRPSTRPGDVMTLDIRNAILPSGISVAEPMTDDPILNRGYSVVAIRGCKVGEDEPIVISLLCSVHDMARFASYFAQATEKMVGDPT
jgi:hypothetical protein